jgi:hypothetical protein
MRVDVVEQKILVDLTSGDEGVCLGNKMFLCIGHQVMRADPLEPKILVFLLSCDEGVPL